MSRITYAGRALYRFWQSGTKPGGQLGEFYSDDHLRRVLARQAAAGNTEATVMLDELGWGGGGGRHGKGGPKRDGPTGGSLSSGVETLGPMILDLVHPPAPAVVGGGIALMGDPQRDRVMGPARKGKEAVREAEKRERRRREGGGGGAYPPKKGTSSSMSWAAGLDDTLELLQRFRCWREARRVAGVG